MKQKNVEYNLKSYMPVLDQINTHLSVQRDDAQIKSEFSQLREKAKTAEDILPLMPIVFALVFQVAQRTLKLTTHNVQLLAAVAMAHGRIVELPTGEGKTLSAVFVACLGALSGKGVHVLTFNDYLAMRDANWMKPIYDFFGISVAHIEETMTQKDRKQAYLADITYLTAKESGFDYLRRFLAYEPEEIAQRDFYMAIVDEADSILMDEARIPLVIAGGVPAQVDMDIKLLQSVASLTNEVHYAADEYGNNITLTEDGISYMEAQLGLVNLYDTDNLELLTKIGALLQALFLLNRDVDYIVKNGEVLLIDEFTGRIAHNRQWSDGLQAAVELKEGLRRKSQGVILNRITLQHFMQFYKKLCGMTGTASSSAIELYTFYDKTVTVIPPDKPCIRMDQPDIVYATKDAKNKAIIKEIQDVHHTGRPMLVGTSSIEESEQISALLKECGLPHTVLNAKNDAQEAEIIANAGQLGAIIISTNMAGRGVDIRLGGNDEKNHQAVCDLGGLYVIGTNRHESARIDNQLRGRAGRQGDPGESRFFVSMEDDLMVKYRLSESLPDKYRNLQNDDQPLHNSVINRAIIHTQKVSEGQLVDTKITLHKYSSLVEDQRQIVAEKRLQILLGESTIDALRKKNPEKYEAILTQVSQGEFNEAQRIMELYAINQGWANHLVLVENALDEVQIISQVKGDPVGTYNTKLQHAFAGLESHIQKIILDLFDRVVIHDGKINLLEMGVQGPSSTRTYMVNDGTEQYGLIDGLPAALSAPLYGFYLLTSFLIKKNKKKQED